MPVPGPQTTLFSRSATHTQEALGLRAWNAHPARMSISHRHNDLELNLVERGSTTYFFGGRRIFLPAGTVILFWAIAPHQLVECEDSTHMYWLTLPLAWFLHQRWPEAFRRAVLNCELVYDRQSREKDHHQFLQWEADLEAGSEDQVEIVLLEVEARLKRMALQAIDDNPAPLHAAGHTLNQAEKIARVLSERFLEPITIESAAGAVGLHPNYAMSVFRKAYGQTMVEYLSQLRIAHAQQLLVNTDQNILEIALQSGFGSVSQFYAIFKRLCGLSPRAYRESLR